MSKASASCTVKFRSNRPTYSADIMDPKGNVYQEYLEYASGVATGVTPNFQVTQPELAFVCASSRVAQGIADVTAMKCMFGSRQILFDTSGACLGLQTTAGADTSAQGVFTLHEPDASSPYWRLRIIKDIVNLAGGQPVNITMIGTIADTDGNTDEMQASYQVNISRITGRAYRLTIVAGDANMFTIQQKGGTCILKGELRDTAGNLVTSDVTWQWQKLTASGWTAITGATGDTLTVREEDVKSFAKFRLIATRGSETYTDVQGVMDVSDPYILEPNPVPLDETIDEDDTNGSVVYTPKLFTRGSSTPVAGQTFDFVAMSAAGVVLSGGNASNVTSFAVTHAMAQQAASEGDVSVTIYALD